MFTYLWVQVEPSQHIYGVWILGDVVLNDGFQPFHIGGSLGYRFIVGVVQPLYYVGIMNDTFKCHLFIRVSTLLRTIAHHGWFNTPHPWFMRTYLPYPYPLVNVYY